MDAVREPRPRHAARPVDITRGRFALSVRLAGCRTDREPAQDGGGPDGRSETSDRS